MKKIEFWKDRDAKIIDPELFSKTAELFARQIAQDNNQSSKTNKGTQLRKFFDEIIRLNMVAKANRDGWAGTLPLVHMVTAKAAYASGRKLISNNFMKFIKESVEQVKSPEDLDVFTSFFEAFIGFYKLYGPSN